MLDVVWDVLVNLIAVFLVFLGRLLGFDLYARMVRGVRWARVALRRLGGRGTVLLYTDCDDELHTARALANHLQNELRDLGCPVKLRIVKDGTDLNRWSCWPTGVLAVLVLLTDVTQLSSDPRERERVQNQLIRYVHRGGLLVLGHDVVYRRSRNERLQRLAGCALDAFERTAEPVRYVRVDSGERATNNVELQENLAPEITLADNEVVLGEWNDDVEYLYTWHGNADVPLVTRRGVGRGRVFWVNSGDSNAKGPPRALARPEAGLVTLLATLITRR